MRLDKEVFLQVIDNAPLISIDLLVKNGSFILLGKRVNEPAKGYWFVPGGRVYKDETLDDAFLRLSKDELGLELTRKQSKFHGLYEHFYKNCVFADNITTHYIVLAHEVTIDMDVYVNSQHEVYRWFEIDELMKDDKVHRYTKDYFRKVK